MSEYKNYIKDFPHLEKPSLNMGELYNPLIEYAIKQDTRGLDYLDAIVQWYIDGGEKKSAAELEKIVQDNLDYYCQYYSKETANKVKEFYGLGLGFVDLSGKKHKGDLTPEEIFNLGKQLGEKSKRERKANKMEAVEMVENPKITFDELVKIRKKIESNKAEVTDYTALNDALTSIVGEPFLLNKLKEFNITDFEDYIQERNNKSSNQNRAVEGVLLGFILGAIDVLQLRLRVNY